MPRLHGLHGSARIRTDCTDCTDSTDLYLYVYLLYVDECNGQVMTSKIFLGELLPLVSRGDPSRLQFTEDYSETNTQGRTHTHSCCTSVPDRGLATDKTDRLGRSVGARRAS